MRAGTSRPPIYLLVMFVLRLKAYAFFWTDFLGNSHKAFIRVTSLYQREEEGMKKRVQLN